MSVRLRAAREDEAAALSALSLRADPHAVPFYRYVGAGVSG